jgi:cell division septum initiation protein DivIVA
MGTLVQQREELERRVDDLRAFEREYRSRLRAYLEGQLRDLDAGDLSPSREPSGEAEQLERRVDDLRAFEREYRSRLRAYLEGQLRDLEAGIADSGTFPAVPSNPPYGPIRPPATGPQFGVEVRPPATDPRSAPRR